MVIFNIEARAWAKVTGKEIMLISRIVQITYLGFDLYIFAPCVLSKLILLMVILYIIICKSVCNR